MVPKINKTFKKTGIDNYLNQKCEDENQIDKDIHRTIIPGGLKEEQKRVYYDWIRKILVGYCNRSKSVGYVQGMNIMVSALLFNICDDFDHLEDIGEDAFRLFVNLMDGYEIGDSFKHKMVRVVKMYKELELRIEKDNPDLFRHIMKTDVILEGECF